jgi:hypothetical protein
MQIWNKQKSGSGSEGAQFDISVFDTAKFDPWVNQSKNSLGSIINLSKSSNDNPMFDVATFDIAKFGNWVNKQKSI